LVYFAYFVVLALHSSSESGQRSGCIEAPSATNSPIYIGSNTRGPNHDYAVPFTIHPRLPEIWTPDSGLQNSAPCGTPPLESSTERRGTPPTQNRTRTPIRSILVPNPKFPTPPLNRQKNAGVHPLHVIGQRPLYSTKEKTPPCHRRLTVSIARTTAPFIHLYHLRHLWTNLVFLRPFADIPTRFAGHSPLNRQKFHGYTPLHRIGCGPYTQHLVVRGLLHPLREGDTEERIRWCSERGG
jgi:hypothetical protein